MLSKVRSAAVTGIDAYPVEVEVNSGRGDTPIVIVVNKTPKRIAPLILRDGSQVLTMKPEREFTIVATL